MRRRSVLAGVLALGLWATGAPAHNHDRAQAERLQQLGKVLPLQDVLARVAKDYPGQVLKVEFEEEDGQGDCAGAPPCEGPWVYELKILQDQGRLIKIRVDAHTGRISSVGRRPLRGEERHR
ncbi:PepSY domain-containing protein [Castellaniella sp. MT123]|uniref:PepSY domain-containing protein n=1 Tax=Castellaniella sp. MT123 TaxID=3140381 RepID=UPI0031F47984